MAKRLQITVDDELYRTIQKFARGKNVGVAEWVRQVLSKAEEDANDRAARKLRAIAEAYKHNHPTADIDQMLEEIEIGRNL